VINGAWFMRSALIYRAPCTLKSRSRARARAAPSLPINPPDIFPGRDSGPQPTNIRANSRPFLLRFQLNENHNHKPLFINCSNYAPVLKEEEPRGTVVFQVQAQDKDPKEDGGNVAQCDIIKYVVSYGETSR